MGRGTLYHITKDPKDLGDFHEQDFYEQLDALAVDFVQDQDNEDAAAALESLAESLTSAGFEIKNHDLPEHCAFILRTPPRTEELKTLQASWFRGSLDTLKNELSKTTPEQFATDLGLVITLQTCLDDRHGDAVCLDMGTGPATYTLMGFMRRLQPGTDYHIEDSTIYMH